MLCKKSVEEYREKKIEKLGNHDLVCYLSVLTGAIRAINDQTLNKLMDRVYYTVVDSMPERIYHGVGEHSCKINYGVDDSCQLDAI